jgi:cytochrome c2
VCHNVTAGGEKKGGPELKGLFQKARLSDGQKPTEAAVRARIDKGGNGMPPFEDMAKDEKDHLIAYLKTL